jgi:hypothetical protein
MEMKRSDSCSDRFNPPFSQKHIPITKPELKIILVETVWKNVKQGPMGTKTVSLPKLNLRLETEIRAGRKQLVLFLNTLSISNTPPLATCRPQRLWTTDDRGEWVTLPICEPNHFGVKIKNSGELPYSTWSVLVFLMSLFRDGWNGKSN